MSIKIIDDDQPIYLTREEYERLWDEYQRAMMFYAGHISFESWVRSKKAGVTTTHVLAT